MTKYKKLKTSASLWQRIEADTYDLMKHYNIKLVPAGIVKSYVLREYFYVILN